MADTVEGRQTGGAVQMRLEGLMRLGWTGRFVQSQGENPVNASADPAESPRVWVDVAVAVHVDPHEPADGNKEPSVSLPIDIEKPAWGFRLRVGHLVEELAKQSPVGFGLLWARPPGLVAVFASVRSESYSGSP